uniref:VWFA domain-containing protein n=1 Tax=Scophthalmus maximus TaxID=52904 RepID=A0A8D3AGY5_SCOMX
MQNSKGSKVEVRAIPLSLAFNIDMTNPDVYTGEKKDFFGYKVLQFKSGSDKGIIVTAPLQFNGSGGVCKPDKKQSGQCFNDKIIPVKHFGLSIAADSTSSEFTVCSPSVAHECYQNSYLNSVCYKITDHLQTHSTFKPAFQECTKKTVDLVFLFDGSGSMKEEEFQKNKDFIEDIMNNLKNTSIKCAAVQFSTTHRRVFDFNDYQDGSALPKLRKEPHMGNLTNTHSALKFIMNILFKKHILENPTAGASPDATKVLVIITDGDPSDGNRDGIIEQYDKKSIIRFVIGVKDAKMDKFKNIASEPTDKYAFKIENYNGLTGILQEFQKKIFKMEGDVQLFSSLFDTLILGSVGSKSWRGSLQVIHGKTEIQIEDPLMQNDSYMGYSVSVGNADNAPLYFTGAPRFEHTGQVVFFRHDGEKWAVAQRLDGDQIGSYFGAELCSVDIDSDGNTDFLLVGAPLFYQHQEKREGLVYVYTLTDETQLKTGLNVTAPAMGRFGTAISSLADLNGDGLQDIAVGAPLEDDDRGAVYIFLGHRHTGIGSTFSQRIMGQEVEPGLRFFGQAINGGIDLGEDGLPDIVIGSQGAAVVLRSRPVFDIMARLSFLPEEISTDFVDKKDEHSPMVNLTVCFEMLEKTKSKGGAMSSGLNITYMLNVDPMRQAYRGFFGADKKDRNLTSTYNLSDNETCFIYPIYMPQLSPISISMNIIIYLCLYTSASNEVPFEKQCAKNDSCIAELVVDFNLATPTLLVREDNYFNVSVRLSNHGDDSYNTSLTMYYPPGLSFSWMTLTEVTRPTLHSCQDTGALDKTVCDVSLPVYRSRSSATFKTSFYILTEYEWNDTISMTITGRSDNSNITSNNSLTKIIPVQFEIKMAVTVREDTTTYLNFTADDAAPKRVDIIYKIDNPGLRGFPVNVSLFFPTKLEHNFEMKDYQVTVPQNKTQCSVADFKSEHCPPGEHCKTIACDTFILDKASATEFMLSGLVQFKDLKKQAESIAFLKRYTGDSREVKFKSFIRVKYDRRRYVLESRKQEVSGNMFCFSCQQTEVRVESIILPNRLLIILTGVGDFLFNLHITELTSGCEKHYYQEEENTEPTSAPTNGINSQSETEGKSDQPSEEKSLLDDGETNGSDPAADTKIGLE